MLPLLLFRLEFELKGTFGTGGLSLAFLALGRPLCSAAVLYGLYLLPELRSVVWVAIRRDAKSSKSVFGLFEGGSHVGEREIGEVGT